MNLNALSSNNTLPQLWSSFPQDILDKLSSFIDLSSYLIIIIAIYIIFLIMKQIFKFKDRERLKIIADNSVEINKKLGILIKEKKRKKK